MLSPDMRCIVGLCADKSLTGSKHTCFTILALGFRPCRHAAGHYYADDPTELESIVGLLAIEAHGLGNAIRATLR
jgi:hypothetical protein